MPRLYSLQMLVTFICNVVYTCGSRICVYQTYMTGENGMLDDKLILECVCMCYVYR